MSSRIERGQEVQTIDGRDRVLMPAGIEIYTEFSLLDSVDDFEIGSKAALAGGTTTVYLLLFPFIFQFIKFSKVHPMNICQILFKNLIFYFSRNASNEANS